MFTESTWGTDGIIDGLRGVPERSMRSFIVYREYIRDVQDHWWSIGSTWGTGWDRCWCTGSSWWKYGINYSYREYTRDVQDHWWSIGSTWGTDGIIDEGSDDWPLEVLIQRLSHKVEEQHPAGCIYCHLQHQISAIISNFCLKFEYILSADSYVKYLQVSLLAWLSTVCLCILCDVCI